ncbi:MAG TPA: hypothetical protein VJW73_05980 [Gemmatimonadaceae bacterium]|nr:hypothetical protein [Gemmatimonadaceae bacterium]
MSDARMALERNSRFLVSRLLAIGVVVTAVSSCSDAIAPRDEPRATFVATVSGSTERQLAGTATFDRDVPGFGLSLVHGSGLSGENAVRHAVMFRRRITGAPEPGEYTVASESEAETNFTAGVVLDGDGDDPLFCGATSGTLHISAVSTKLLRGTFAMTALCARIGSEDALIPIEVAGTFLATEGKIEAPDEPTAVAGARYVLSTVNGSPVPYLLRDFTDDDGLRSMKWLLADTIQFLPDGQLSFSRTYRYREESAGSPADEWDYSGSLGGYFRQGASKVAVAWGYITVPTDAQYSDTLRLRPYGLVRSDHLPPGCLLCPIGPLVEYVYGRR